MGEPNPEQVRRAVTEAAEMVKGLPETLQVAAFNKVFDAMIGTSVATLPSGTNARSRRGRDGQTETAPRRSKRARLDGDEAAEGKSEHKSDRAVETGTEEPAGAAKSDGARRLPARARSRGNARVGPKAALEQLLELGYFDQPRTIRDIVSHLQQRRALTFASTDISPTLVRLLREQKLDRLRNADNQYEYRRPERA
jgi:hypothetical protein